MVIQVAVIALSCSLLVAPAQQQEAPRNIDIKSVLSGRLPAGATVVQQGPFTSMSIPISRDQLPMLRAMAGFGLDEEEETGSDALNISKVYPLAVGASILRPTFFLGITSNDVTPLEFSEYYYYWISVNFNDRDLTKSSKFTLKGPGNGFNISGPVRYDAETMILLWVREDPVDIVGIYKLDVKVSGRPKIRGVVCAGC